MNEPCPINSLRSLPDNCTLIINPSLPDGFSLSSTGVLSAQPQSYMEKAEYTISCEDSYYETTLSLLVSGLFFFLFSLINRYSSSSFFNYINYI